MNFQKFMICNERSPIKMDESNLVTGTFWEYPCYDELENLMDNCGSDLMEPLFEIYRVRLLSQNLKPREYGRIHTNVDKYGTFSDRKVLHY